MKKKLNIIISNSPLFNGNKGCVALTYSTILLLDDILKEKKIEHTFFLPDSGAHWDNKEHEITIWDVSFSYISCARPSLKGVKNLMRAIVKPKKFLKSRKIYKKADFLLDIGQGDSFADIYGEGRFSMIDRQYRLARKYHIPYCILPQTIGPFKSPEVKKMARKTLEAAKCVMTRDAQSLCFAKEIAPAVKMDEFIDMAFFLPYKKVVFDSNYIHVGLNISALLWNGGYTGRNQFDLVDDYKKLVRLIVDYFLSQNGVKLHLISHVLSSEADVENDYQIASALYNDVNNPNLILAPFFMDPICAKNYISGLDFFSGSRMHATIAAFSSGVPVVPLAYSRKFNGLFEDTLQYAYVGNLLCENNDAVLKKVKDSYEQRLCLKQLIDGTNEGVVAEKKEKLKQKLIDFLGI